MVGDHQTNNDHAGQLLKAVNASAGRVRGSWLSYQAMGAYFFVVVGATTHSDLLLGTAIKLPILQIDLPILTFYFLAPGMFLLFHLNLMLQLYLLSGKLEAYWEARGEPAYRDREVPYQADQFVFVQWALGDNNSLILRVLILLMVRGTVIVAPPVLLLFFQVRFLPYHHDWLTHWHRGILLVDILSAGIIWLNFNEILGKRRLWGDLRRFFWNLKQWLGGTVQGLWQKATKSAPINAPFARPVFLTGWTRSVNDLASHLALGVFMVLTLYFSLLVATLPGERLAIWTKGIPFFTSTTQWFFEGDVNPFTGKRTSFFSRTLVTPNFVSTDSKSKPALRGRDLRGRDLRGAVWLRAELPGVDFTGADLRGANFSNANLKKAIFSCPLDENGSPLLEKCTKLQKAKLKGADLRGANLQGAGLQGADLRLARLQGANLGDAHLQGADLRGAGLQGANLENAGLQGANLENAGLQGATLRDALLQGADLRGAGLQGADLRFARLQGADLRFANLQGSNLEEALFQGANLGNAGLQGANLRDALLLGANLQGADLQGADLRFANLQGAILRNANLQGVDLKFGRVWRTDMTSAEREFADTGGAEWTALSKQELDNIEAESVEGIEDEALRERILNTVSSRLEVLRGEGDPEKDAREKNEWVKLSKDGLNRIELENLLAFLVNLACSENKSTYIAAGLVMRANNFPNFDVVLFADQVMTGKKGCPAWEKLDEGLKEQLRKAKENELERRELVKSRNKAG